jgi:glycosyltransferase involved in cell wall biosynthesis
MHQRPSTSRAAATGPFYAEATRVIAFNLAFLNGTALSGPGYHAVQLFEAMAELIGRDRPDVKLLGFLRADARRHFGARAQDRLVTTASPARRVTRVLWEQTMLPLLARRHRVDLLFSPAFVSPLWGAPRLAAFIHDMYFAVIPELIDQRQRRYWEWMIPPTIRRCDRLLTNSEQTRRDLEAFAPAARGKTAVTRLASRLGPHLTSEAADVAGPFLLVVANLTRNKNIEAVTAALAQLRAQGFEVRLVHVGADPDRRLATAARAEGLEGAVDALGKVSEGRLVGLYRSAFAVVTASTYEGFGMPAVEAQAMGAPLVSSDAGALPEAAGPDGALYFDPARPEELASQLLRLRDEPGLRDVLIARGRMNNARYSWADAAAETMAVFDSTFPGDR